MNDPGNSDQQPPLQVQPEDSPAATAGPAGTPPARSRPAVMTLSLVVANLAMAFAQFAAGGYRLRDEIGSYPGDWALGAKIPTLIAHGEFWRLVTANFLHGSWFPHLFFNMLALLILGRLIEAFYGPARMLVIYTVGCVAGTVAGYQLSPSISLGASTGIMGLMGALLVHNMKYRPYLPERLNRIQWILLSLLMFQFLLDRVDPRVDQWGHLGGLVGGGLMAALLEGRIAGPLQNDRDWLPLPTALGTAAMILAYGAFGLLTSLPREVDLLRAGRAPNLAAETAQLRRALERRPYFAEGRLYLIRVLFLQGQVLEGKALYEQMSRERPGLVAAPENADLTALMSLSEALAAYREGRWNDALAACSRVIRLDPDPRLDVARAKAEAHNQYAWILVDKLDRSYPEAETHAKLANELHPNEPAFLDTLAWVYFKEGRLVKALDLQKRAVELMPQQERRLGPDAAEDVAGLYYHLGAIHEGLGQRSDAIANYRLALRTKADYSEAARALERLAAPLPQPDRRIPSLKWRPARGPEFI